MNLHVTIRDENDAEMGYIEILQDGSDSEGVERIREMLRDAFKIVADPNHDEFECEECGRVLDIDDSIRLDGELFCSPCAKRIKNRWSLLPAQYQGGPDKTGHDDNGDSVDAGGACCGMGVDFG